MGRVEVSQLWDVTSPLLLPILGTLTGTGFDTPIASCCQICQWGGNPRDAKFSLHAPWGGWG